MRYLRNKNDGTIYHWNAILAANPLCEEVTEQEAYPERFRDEKQIEKVVRQRKKRGSSLDLGTTDIPQEPVYTPPELAEEASRGL